MEKIAFLVIFFLAYTIQGVTGFAGNILCMPPGIMLLGMSESVTVLNATGFMGCGILAVKLWKYIDWRQFLRVIVVLAPFLFLGIWLDTVLPLNVLLTVYGVIIVAVALRNLFIKRELHTPEWLLWFVVAAAGVIQGMFVSGGVFLVIWATHKLKDREAFRGTLSIIWVFLNAAYLVVKIFQGGWTPASLQMVLFAIPVLVIATFLGDWLQKRISKEGFMKFTYWLLVAMGSIMTVTSLI